MAKLVVQAYLGQPTGTRLDRVLGLLLQPNALESISFGALPVLSS